MTNGCRSRSESHWPIRRAIFDHIASLSEASVHDGAGVALRYSITSSASASSFSGTVSPSRPERCADRHLVLRGCLPVGDIMLAQKITLETDEHAALAVANRGR